MKTWKTPKGTELQLRDLRGQDYLDVKWRYVWMREERSLWGIETEFVTLTDTYAIAKATVKDESGRIIATAHKREDKAHFADFLEKAETSAAGRALAMCGYGTQFCGDEMDEGERLADSPVEKQNTHAAKRMQPGANDGFHPSDLDGIYRVPFGAKFKDKTLDEICHDPKFGPDAIKSYIVYLETTATKRNYPLSTEAVEFIKRAESYLGHLENGDVT